MPSASLSSSSDVIRLHGVAPESIVDGPGLRYAIFSQGCKHNCPGCHNPESHDLCAGYTQSIESIYTDILTNPILTGVTFSGGEPFLQAQAFCTLGRLLTQKKLPILTFTGYTLEQLERLAQKDFHVAELLNLSSMLVDGPFMQDLRDENLRFCGSSNQRFWSKKDGNWFVNKMYTYVNNSLMSA